VGDNIGGCIDTYPANNTGKAKAIAAVMSSKLGMGSSFRTIKGDKPIPVNTVPFGSWNRKIFDYVGLFDESFTRAHDLEHNIRMKKMETLT